ncbi:hypothetical protein D3C71_189500 [compost metagenome]
MRFPVIAAVDHRPLVDELSKLIGPTEIDDIAGSDYGSDRAQHAEAIRRIVRTHEIPEPLDWIPREVFALTRWDTPSEVDPAIWRSKHACRAFSAAALLVADTRQPHEGTGGENTSMAALADSAIELGGSIPELAADFTAWAIARLDDEEEAPFFGLAFLALAMPFRKRWTDEAMMSVAHWVMDMEDAVAAPWRASLGLGPEGEWLLPVTPFRMRDEIWRRLGAALAEQAAAARRGKAITETSALIGAMLA